MKKVYYEKVGRKYVPVAEYDSDYIDSFPKGTHLVMCYPGGKSTRYNVDPNYAAMIAAGRVAEDAICAAMVEASKLRPMKTLLTPGQRQAWEKLAQEMGDELCTLTHGSVRDHVEAGIKAMQEEANKLMKKPAVRLAYRHFLFVCELSKESASPQD